MEISKLRISCRLFFCKLQGSATIFPVPFFKGWDNTAERPKKARNCRDYQVRISKYFGDFFFFGGISGTNSFTSLEGGLKRLKKEPFYLFDSGKTISRENSVTYLKNSLFVQIRFRLGFLFL